MAIIRSKIWLESSITQIGKQRDILTNRLALIQKSYLSQYSALDTLVASLQATGTYLSQQITSLQNNPIKIG